MAQKQRFRTGTKGYNGEVFVATGFKSVADIEAFSALLPADAGKIAFFNEDGTAVAGALEEGQIFYVAQLRVSPDGTTEVKKSTEFVYKKSGTLGVDYVAPVKQQYTVTFPGYTPVAGKEITVKTIEAADESHRPPTYSFTYRIKPGDTLAKLYEGLANEINNQPEAYGTQDDYFVKATASANGLVLEHLFEQATFSVALPGESYDIGVVTATTPAVFGSGFYDEIAQLEFEGEVFDGVTTQYPGGNFVPSDFPSTTRFAKEGAQYNKYQVNSVKNEYSPTPVNLHHHLKHLVLAVDAASTDDITAVETALGLS